MNDQQKPLSRRGRRNSSDVQQKTSSSKPSDTATNPLKWLKYVLIPVLLLLLLVVGAMLGYSVFGEKEVNKGRKADDYKVRPAFEVLKPSTWKHMFDLVFKTD